MMTDLSEGLCRIKVGFGKPSSRHLAAGAQAWADASRGCRQIMAAGLPHNMEVETLYVWRDGTQTAGATLDDLHLFPGFYLLSLEDVLANYRSFVTDPRWNHGWLPLFTDGAGDFYLVELGGRSSGWVRRFRIDEAEHPVEFRSLTDMVVTLAAAFDRGVFFIDSDGYLEMNDLRFGKLAAELNPAVHWWTDQTR
ncbi:hypothetical protein AADG42_18935 [Ammonicoccus fulvus]|uniref:Knr4/Smi1-like domain-containing protein n=1 Tax=Ammonicoccus fulvus TaxID=3138240 RepID=A0ABZ3FXJ5_9ACTN